MPKTEQESGVRRTIVGLTAIVAAVVLIVVAVVALRDGGDDDPLTVAEAFVDARDRWDGDAVRALLADDAAIDGFVDAPDDYLTNDEFERATEWRFMEPTCAESSDGPAGAVRCTYVMSNAWSEALGEGPFDGSRFDFVVADGQIRELTHFFQIGRFSGLVWGPFLRWVQANHPDDIDRMYDWSHPITVPITTPEAVVLWEAHTAEFVAEQG